MSLRELFTTSLSRAEKVFRDEHGQGRFRFVLHHCNLDPVSVQQDPRELELPTPNAVWAYCGECADQHPYRDLSRTASATGQHIELVDSWTVQDHLAYQLHGSFEDHVESGRLEVEQEEWRKSLKSRKVRTGELRVIVVDAKRRDYEEFRQDVRNREWNKSPDEVEEIAREEIGYRRASNSKTHLALVVAQPGERGTTIACWRCDTKMRVNRELLAMAVDHVTAFGGTLTLRPTGISVNDSSQTFEVKTHRRGRRKSNSSTDS